MTAIYRKRNNIFGKGESEWRAEDDALVVRGADGSESRLNWADVTWIRLRAFPTRTKPWLHQFRIATAKTRMDIDNSDFLSAGRFADRSADYSAFVRAALARITACAPNARAYAGSAVWPFALSMGFFIVGMSVLAYALIAIPFPASPPIGVVVKLLVIAFSGGLLWRWVRSNWPRRADLKNIAENLP